MKSNEPTNRIRSLFEQGSEVPLTPGVKQEIGDRQAEAKRIVKRLAAIVEEHRQAALPLKVELGSEDLGSVIGALREHSSGKPGKPVSGSRDEIHAYCLDRLFDELVEEPSNILFTTQTGSKTIRYDAMSTDFWIECLDLMEATFCPPEE